MVKKAIIIQYVNQQWGYALLAITSECELTRHHYSIVHVVCFFFIINFFIRFIYLLYL
jgi:hypothetical protein